MMGLRPTGTVARTWPKPTASIGLAALQLGLVGNALTWQSGMLMTLSEPGVVPVPWFATTSSEMVGTRSAQTGATPTGMVVVGVSNWLVCELMTETVLSVLLRMKERLLSAVITPYTGP